MAYPFVKLPSLEDFRATVLSVKYGAELETIRMSGPRGKTDVEVLVRQIGNDKKRIAVIPDIKSSETLTPHVLRSLCIQLGIDPADFGLDLG